VFDGVQKMVRMEIACFMVLAFMAVLYFSAKREKTKIHSIFSILLIVSMCNLFFDGVTIYTVNHLEEVPVWLNDLCHKFFIGTMVAFFYLMYRYIVLMIEDEAGIFHPKLFYISISTLILMLVVTALMPVYYMESASGNYAVGPAANMTYVAIAYFLFLAIGIIVRYWKQIHPKKKIIISTAFGIELIISFCQLFFPTLLISGMGIMLINLAFYLTMENPDLLLVEQIRREKEKADAANASKSNFLSNVSHEIRTPMNSIVGMSEILLRTDLTAKQREYLNTIQSSGTALVAIVNDVLDISKIEAGKMVLNEAVYEIHPFVDEIKKVVDNIIGHKPVTLCCKIADNVPEQILGDGLRVRQIIINLLGNAVKFTEEGRIILSVHAEDLSGETFRLCVSVQDTGQGIREKDMERLFGAFEQADEERNRGKEGTGLGLTISNEFVRMMGGKMSVQSEYEEGSTFSFYIMQKIGKKATDNATQELSDNRMTYLYPGAKVLIVDDNELNLKVAGGLLEPLKMELDFAKSGMEAIEKTKNTQYDLIFMDHMMPFMDGIEATRRIRETEGGYYKDFPIIALTANVMKDAREMLLDSGLNAVVAKPIEMKEICDALFQWLPKRFHQNAGECDILKGGTNGQEEKTSEMIGEGDNLPELPGIDVATGIRYCGSRDAFVQLLGDLYRLIDLKADKIEHFLSEDLIRDYTIEVHAMKSTMRSVGALQLSEAFAELERYGNLGDLATIQKNTPEVLKTFRGYKEILKPFGEKLEEEKKAVSKEEIIFYISGIRDSTEAFDLDGADAAMAELEKCRLPEKCRGIVDKLRAYVADVDMEAVLGATEELLNVLDVQGED